MVEKTNEWETPLVNREQVELKMEAILTVKKISQKQTFEFSGVTQGGNVKKAVEALVGLLKISDGSKGSSVSLIDVGKKIDLQFSVGKVHKARTTFSLCFRKNDKNVQKRILRKAILDIKRGPGFVEEYRMVDLPHSVDEDGLEVCLFVADLDRKDREYEKTVIHFQDLFKKKGVTNKITKIIPIKALRTDFCEPHNRRTLAKAYDIFLADRKITGLLPALLGKIFYGRSKTVPRKVHLESQNLKDHLDKLISRPMCEMRGRGFSSVVQVAHDKMSKDEIIDNIMKALEIVTSRVPGGKSNLRSVHISAPNEKAIPLYFNHVNPSDINLPEIKKDKFLTIEDEVTTVEDGLVRVQADGYVKVINKKRKANDKEVDKDVKEKKPKLEVKDEVVEVKEEEETDNKKKKRIKMKKDDKKGNILTKKQMVWAKLTNENKDSMDIKEEEIEVKEEHADDLEVEKHQTNKKGKKRKGTQFKTETSSQDSISKNEKKNEKIYKMQTNKANKKGIKTFSNEKKDNGGGEKVGQAKGQMNRKNKKFVNQDGNRVEKLTKDKTNSKFAAVGKGNKKGPLWKIGKNKNVN